MPDTTLETETVIIGAGAAGLAAAAELAAHGRECAIIEARHRLGGRVFTRFSSTAVPLELGAEFIHGESAAILDRLRASGAVAIDAAEERWTLRGRQLRRADDQFDALKRGLEQLAPPAPDVSFDAFLKRHQRALPASVRKLACSLVEGFDAADPARISAREVLAEWSGPASADVPTFRPSRGYGPLLEAMHRALPGELVSCRFDTVVRGVTWQRHSIELAAMQRDAPVRVRAKRAIVTLPVGVLQAPAGSPGAVRFAPDLGDSKRNALSLLAAGPVVKVVLEFKQPFWARMAAQRYRDAAFFFTREQAIPTFWSSLPLRSATLVGWSGGPKAARLTAGGEGEILREVVRSLRSLFGARNYAALLLDMHWHDWQRDPYARGAYSYVATGGGGARRALARPVADTLFFAGEACDTTGEAGTVAGAFNSGALAARQVVRSLRAQ